jgi:trehalose 6-phosphate synthase
MGRAISRALLMPLDERRERWNAMITTLKANSAQAWFSGFVTMLEETAVDSPAPALPLLESPAIALRSEPEALRPH